MRFAVLGSGSSGNATWIEHGGVSLLIDAGLSGVEIARRMVAIGEDPGSLSAVLITHEHGDHIAGLEPLIKMARPMLFCSKLTYAAIRWKREPNGNFVQTFQVGDRFKVATMEVQSFTIPHDAQDPAGFTVEVDGCKLGLAMDLGYIPASVRHHLQGCDAMILEANHDPSMLANGSKPPFVKQRVASRVGHLSNEALGSYICSDDYDRKPRRIVLGHLSREDNTAALASLAASRALQSLHDATTELTVATQTEATSVFSVG